MTTTSHSEDGRALGIVPAGPSSPAGFRRSRPAVYVTNWRWPGGATLYAPTPDDPCWRGSRGQEHVLSEVISGQPAARRDELLELHRLAICETVRVASELIRARASGPRPYVAAATRLCNELLVR